MQTENAYYERMNQYLRDEVAVGDEIEAECSDRSDRSLTVISRTQLANGSIVMKAEGYGTTYQINVPSEKHEGACISVRWPSGYAFIRGLDAVAKGASLWTDTTAEDLGIPGR